MRRNRTLDLMSTSDKSARCTLKHFRIYIYLYMETQSKYAAAEIYRPKTQPYKRNVSSVKLDS